MLVSEMEFERARFRAAHAAPCHPLRSAKARVTVQVDLQGSPMGIDLASALVADTARHAVLRTALVVLEMVTAVRGTGLSHHTKSYRCVGASGLLPPDQIRRLEQPISRLWHVRSHCLCRQGDCHQS